jgi:hypothetical protein
MSLVAVSTVVVLAASFSQFASSVANRQAHAIARKRAFYLAEAGLAEAFAGLSCGKSGNVGTEAAPALLGDGVFWVEATELEPGFVRLEATGMIGTGMAVLALVAQRGEESVGALGVFSGGDVMLGDGTLVDAYDSTKGDYELQTDKTGAALGSNGNVAISGSVLQPSVVKGDVTSGPEHTVGTSGSVTISGTQAASLAPVELPAVQVPEVSLLPAQVHSSPYPLVIAGGAAGFEGLTVKAGAQLIIQGPAQVVLGSLELEASAELAFDTTYGAVELYVTDGLDLQPESFVTTTGTRPQEVLLQVPAQTEQLLALRASGAFHGVVYAPGATVLLGPGFEVFGALVADALTFEGAARLHVDRNLAKVSAESALPGQLSWRIVELGNVSGTRSPFISVFGPKVASCPRASPTFPAGSRKT